MDKRAITSRQSRQFSDTWRGLRPCLVGTMQKLRSALDLIKKANKKRGGHSFQAIFILLPSVLQESMEEKRRVVEHLGLARKRNDGRHDIFSVLSD